MTRKAGRSIVAVVVLLALSPTLVFGQAVKAGVVTTLEGQVTAARVATPAPVALRFKDDIFLQDRITTGENSFARLLLGGKAVVSVRERSIFSVTEIPGQSIVDLQSGKLAVGVARERMRPGEVIELRTPSAIVAVRGTVLIAEVQILADGSRREVVYLLRGTAEAQARPAAGVAPRAPVVLAPFQSVTVVGGVLTVATFTVSDLPRITGGLKPKGMQLAASSSESKKTAQKATQDALATLLLVGNIRPFTPPSLQPPPDVAVAPITPISCAGGTACPDDIAQLVPPVTPPVTPPTTPPTTPPETIPETPIAIISPGRITGPGDASLLPGGIPFDNPPVLPLSDPYFRIVDATVTQASGDLINVAALPVSQIPGRLLEIVNSQVSPGSSLLVIDAPFVSGGNRSLVDIDPSTVTAPGDVIRVEGNGALSLATPLLTARSSTLQAGGSFLHVDGPGASATFGTGILGFQDTQVAVGADLIRVLNGALLVSGDTLVTLANSQVAAGGLLQVSGAVPGEGFTPALVGLSNSLLNATSSSITTSGSVVLVQNGGVLSAGESRPGAGALLQLGATPLTAGTGSASAALLQVDGVDGDGNPSQAGLAARLLVASASPLSIPGGLLSVANGGLVSVVNPLDTPLATLDGAQHAIATTPGEAIFNLRGRADNLVGEGCDGDCDMAVGGDVPLAYLGGPMLQVTNASVSTQQAVRLVDASVDINLASAIAAALISLQGAGSALTTAGDAVSLQRSRLDTAGPIALVNGGVFTVTNGAFVALNGSFLRVGNDLVQIANGGLVNVVNGPLLSLTNGSAAHIAGALAAFISGTNNRLQITNNLCATNACTNVNGVIVARPAGSQSGAVINSSFRTNEGAQGAVTLSQGGAHVFLGNNTTLRTGPQGEGVSAAARTAR